MPASTSSILPAGESDRLVDAATLQRWLGDGHEIALLDVREHGRYGEGHPFFAVQLSYSRLELDVPRLVPRRSTRIVLLDGGGLDRTAAVAARRLAAADYSDVYLLEDGAAAWVAHGYTLFRGVNVPSKTFGELVEHAFGVPHLGAIELAARQAGGKPLVLLDGRTLAEHRTMTIPGARPLPNGELALRWRSLVDDDTTPIVVHCAGRTRSIVGAQILRDLGVPNPVWALENGTQGWALAGLALDRASEWLVPPPQPDPTDVERLAERTRSEGVPRLGVGEAQAWLDDPMRTTYVFDVRTAEECGARTLPGARHAPGGQLLQATDAWIGVRGARVLVLDDDGLRAAIVALWLRRLGIEAATVEGGIDAALAVRQTGEVPVPPLRAIGIAELAAVRSAPLLDPASVPLLLDLRTSVAHRTAHPDGAVWTIRPRVAADADRLTGGARARAVWLLADDPTVAALAAVDLRESGFATLAWTTATAVDASGWPQLSSPNSPTDAESIDYLFFVHDRHHGNLDAARRYLEWETGLVAQCTPEELSTFRLPTPAKAV